MPIYNSKVDRFNDNGGNPVVNGKVYFGQYGTDPRTNPITIYNDELLTTPLTQPQRTDTFGRLEVDVFIGVDYSYEVRNSDDVLIEGALNRRLSARTNVGIADGVSKLDAIEQSANIYEIDAGFAAAPPPAIYYLVFDVPSTAAPQINFANIAGNFPSTGVDEVEAGKLYHACFDGVSWEIINEEDEEITGFTLKGADLANCYQDKDRPAAKTIFQNKLGVLFGGVSAVHPMGYGVFVPKVETIYNIVLTLQATTIQEDKKKNITARFIDSRPEEGNGIINTVTKVDVLIPDSLDEFQVIFERVLDLGMVSQNMEGRWEIEVENASNFNFTGDVFMSQVDFQEVDS